MFRTFAIKMMVAKLSRALFSGHLMLIEDTMHSHDGDTLNLIVMTNTEERLDGMWLANIMGLDATDINIIADGTYERVNTLLGQHYDYVLKRENDYYDSLGFVVLSKGGMKTTKPLRDYVRKCIHNAFRDMYRNVGINLIIENGEVIGLKKLDMTDAERQLYHHYKDSPDELGCFHHEETRVYPFKRIRNRIKFYKEK